MPDVMTSRERLLAAMRCEPVDRVPVSPFELGYLDPDGEVAQRMVEQCDPFLRAFLGVDEFGGACYEYENREEGDLVITTVPTPRGDLRAVVKRTEVTSYSIEFPCKGAEDLEKWLSIPFEPQKVDGTAFRGMKARYGDEGLVLSSCSNAVCLPAYLLSPEDFCLLWADAPDVMRMAVEEGQRRTEMNIQSACDAGYDVFRIIGGEYVSTQLGPRAFEELVVGPDRRLVDLMHSNGALAYYHNHGPMMHYLEAIARIGIDFLDPLEMPPFGDTDLERAREIIDGRYCIVGTFDDMEQLEKYPMERLKDMMRQRVEQYGRIGFCVGGSASGTFGERGAEAFCALAEASKEMG